MYQVYCDGGTYRTNPSLFGYWGFTVWQDHRLLYAQCGKLIGDVDSAYAELKAIERAYEFLTHNPMPKCVVHTDSETSVAVVDRGNNFGGKKQLLGNMVRYQSLTLVGSKLVYVSRENDYQSFTDRVARLGQKHDKVFQSEGDVADLYVRFFS